MNSALKAPLTFDFQATTPCDPEVLAAMAPYWNELWGNPSSRQNRSGLRASVAVSLAREKLASILNVRPENLLFTSGATESNNLALLGHARARAQEVGLPGHVITLSTEHHSVLEPLRQLQKEGFLLTELDPEPDGLLSLQKLEEAFQENTYLVSIMLANNEIGVVQPISKISKLCRERDIIFHSDAAQAFCNLPIEPDQLGIDFLSLSGHKIYGPKGIGALFYRENVSIVPLQWGGLQEHGIRPGTIPVPLVVGLAKAAELRFGDLNSRQERLLSLRNKLSAGLKAHLPNLIVNGSIENRLANNLNITIPNVRGNRLHLALRHYIDCSSGSSCSNGKPSHVLRAIGRTLQESESSIRFSLGYKTTEDDINQAISIISKVVSGLTD